MWCRGQGRRMRSTTVGKSVRAKMVKTVHQQKCKGAAERKERTGFMSGNRCGPKSLTLEQNETRPVKRLGREGEISKKCG